MKELAAYLLAVLGGKAGSAKDVKAILSAAGVEADSDAVDQVLAAVDGKDLAALIADGKKKLVSVGGGGGAAPVAASTGGAAPSGGAAPKKEEKKEEEEEEVGGAGGLFGGGDDDW